MADIVLENIYKMYNEDVTAVSDFNLYVQDKEFIVFVGPSGCGKSTTLRMIAGLEDISTGNLYIGDKRVNDTAPKDRDIAMVFQNYALYPHMTVYDNMAFGLKLRKFKKSEIDKRVQEAAKILGLESMLTRKPKALSGGQRQRVALGRAIVRDPKVFLMDEPLSNLDAKLRVQMRAEITKLHRRLQTTTIYVTHDQTEAMTMATRIVIMKDGVIQQVGAPKEVYDNPNNVFVGGFIGSPAMNFLHGSFQKDHFKLSDKVSFKLPAKYVNLLEEQGYLNEEVILGIRPEDIYDSHFSSRITTPEKITARIEVAELMGSETFLYTKVENQDLIARIHSRTDLTSGLNILLDLDMDKLHFFDVKTENRIQFQNKIKKETRLA